MKRLLCGPGWAEPFWEREKHRMKTYSKIRFICVPRKEIKGKLKGTRVNSEELRRI